ncbi:MAG: YjbH domain-containing protein [Burkholderiaceae bacterium]
MTWLFCNRPGRTLAFSVAAICGAQPVAAQDAAMAMPGYTGVLTVPSAMLMPEGHGEFGYSDYLDRRFSAETGKARNYTAAFGLFDWLELSGRLADYVSPGGGQLPNGYDRFSIRDLSANVKAKIPHNIKWLPEVAVGASDLGGGAPFFKARFGTATFRPVETVRFTAGYGVGPQRLDGVFGGVEWQAMKRLLVLADYDGRDKFVGARLYSPPIPFLNHSQVIGTVMRSINAKGQLPGTTADRTEVSLSIQIPLSGKYDAAPIPVANRRAPLYAAVPPVMTDATAIAPVSQVTGDTAAPAAQEPAVPVGSRQQEAMSALYRKLVAQGFERVRVGELNDALIVEFENNRYNLNDADGAGIVLGLAANSRTTHRRIVALQKKLGLGIFEYRVPKIEFQQFVNGKGAGIVDDLFQFDRRQTYADDAVQWVEDGRASGRAYLRLKLNPRLTSFYGTEYGAFDYSLGLALTQSYPLWKGAEWNSVYVSPLADSENFEQNKPFGYLRTRRDFEGAFLTQSYWLTKYVFNSTSVGQFEYDYRGIQHQSVVFLPYWDHVIRFSRVSMENRIYTAERRRDAGSLSYRVKVPNLDAWAEISQAKYVGGDSGQVLDFTRFFGDVSVGARYRRSDTNEKYVGLVLGLPLTLRQEFKPGPVQLVGPARFVHSINTKLVSPGQTNNILFNSAAQQNLAYDQAGIFLNKGRFSEQYMAGQLARMRNSYTEHVKLEE